MYRIKSIARRATAFGAAIAVLASVVLPSVAVYADALNPLTERSLLLTSSAPGFQDTDGSGNSAGSPNSVGENYAPAGSGPNGKKTGETFTFTHTSTAKVKGLSLQYCTTAAGVCQAPGNNGELVPGYTGDAGDPGDARNGVYDGDTDLDGRPDNEQDAPNEAAGGHVNQKSDLDFVGTFTEGTGAGQYAVYVNGVVEAGWVLQLDNLEDATHTGALTGKYNYVTLSHEDGVDIDSGDEVVIRFRPSETAYITNPGSKEFFVKINTYSDDEDLFGPHNEDGVNNTGPEDHTVIDGGVTVANVMTDSIHITTKVLETMSFSVGTRNRDTVDIGAGQTHGKCDPILTPNNNRLNLGNPNAEFSLETGRAWDVYSYWRLSSNSSGGASVYYSGDTLRNTVGDAIADISSAETVSTPGTEQFGLGFVDPGFGGAAWQDTKDTGAGTWAAGYQDPDSYPFRTRASQIGVAPYNNNPLAPQSAANNYDEAEGTIDNGSGGAGTAKFFFKSTSLTIPELIAQQNETVISCATAKMRYVANIGADTPAGVYTTKINYLAAPQY
jgi:hypothetical protein